MSRTVSKLSSPIPASPETEKQLNFKRQDMEPWYDPSQLARTAIRTLVSGLFGTYADKREMQACLKTADPFDKLAGRDEVWVDYISDLGSGFNPTYSLAYLLGADEMLIPDFNDEEKAIRTERGNILIMGGDQVYPTPSSDQYTNRLTGPYRAARSYVPEPLAPHLFAIPGNHDWYDGLTSFLKLFCQERWIGGWQTHQTRSYFAIKLPYNWWIWGIDIQLSEDIDQPQQTFFENVNRNCTESGDKIILCTAEPAWVYQAYKKQDKSFRNLNYFCEKYITDPDLSTPPSGGKPLKRLSLPLTLTGDLHHYSSYFSPRTADPNDADHLPREWKITVGGGGAFMHPTHHLPVSFSENKDLLDEQLEPKEYQSNAFYPGRGRSRLLALGNLLFPVKNPWFTSLMSFLCLLFTWMMVSSGAFSALAGCPFTWSSVDDVIVIYARNIAVHPFLFLFLLLLGVGFVKFADTSHKEFAWLSSIGGVLHAAVQLAVILTVCWAFYQKQYTDWKQIVQQTVNILVVGGFSGGMVMGLYLLLANGLFSIHETEAFSSLRIQDYKCFLRLHFTKDKLTIYPIKLRRAARRWTYKSGVTNGSPWFEPENPLHPELIERPITIKN